MVKFLISAGLCLLFLFVFVLLGSGMLWVVMRVLRSLFSHKFAPAQKRKGDEV